jgi:SNF2 family DNA or RNA helicase
MQFNILVTTYETIMRDRSKLSKLEWKYIIIDEAQRMKVNYWRIGLTASTSTVCPG